MKRLVLSMAAVLLIGIGSYASDGQPVPQWNTNINVSKLSYYLDLNAAQAEEVRNIASYFTEQMREATRSGRNQQQKLHNAVYGNLKLMRQTLDKQQYAKYLQLMNATLKNNGITLE